MTTKLNGKKFKLSDTQCADIAAAASSYGTCIKTARTEVTGSTINIEDVDTLLDKFKEPAGKCLSEFSSKAKSVLECNE